MFDPRLEELALRVRQAASAINLPVDLVKIADYDEIILQPVSHHEGFNGKIEFLTEENVFVIYHPEPSTYRYPARLRFSIAHELGHFHIDEHRDALVHGITHSSQPGFRSKNPLEIQADEFAAALLIPASTMEPRITKRGFMTLEEIGYVAAQCGTSPYATAIRYVRMASEACLVALAHGGAIKSTFCSDEARLRRFGKLTTDKLPITSPGSPPVDSFLIGAVREQGHDASAWFGRSHGTRVWENCVHLGEGFTLSLISVDLDDGR